MLLLLLFLATALMMGFSILLPSILYVLQNMGASPSLATPVLASYSLAQFVAGPLWGRLSDRVGRKPVLLASLGLSALAYGGLALFATSVWGLLITLAFAGLAAGGMSCLMATAVDVTGARDRARGMGMIGAGVGLAFIVGPALGGVLGGADAAHAGIAAPAVASACASLIGVMMLWVMFREPGVSAGGAAPPMGHLHTLRGLFGRPLLVRLCLLMLVFTVSVALMETATPLLTRDRFDWGPRQLGALFAYVGVLLVVVQGGLVGRLSRRFGERRLVTVAFLLMGLGLVTIAFSASLWTLLPGLTLTSLGAAFFASAMPALASHQADSRSRGAVMGSVQAMQALGRTLGPVFAGLFFQIRDDLPFLVGASVMVLGLVWFMRLLPPGRNDAGSRPDEKETSEIDALEQQGAE